ncbi:MAG: VOC family protein [Bacteroidota bacterium]|nr:VOC family protein [Bacteroidota bacterium]
METSIYPCLWMDENLKEAAQFYCNIFKNAQIISENPMVIVLQINGAPLMLLNGGPQFPFTEAISLVVPCHTQKEIDAYWDLLGKDGSTGKCGWLKDKYGLSWQIIPANLNSLLNNASKATQVVYELMQMEKINLKKLEEA